MEEESWEPGKPANPYLIIILIVVVVAAAGWLATHVQRSSAQDKRMLQAAQVLDLGLNRYYSDHTEFAMRLEQAADYLPVDTPWPVNPYNGQPIADCGSEVFDPATSVGMVHLEPLIRNEVQIGWNLHVFGAKGELDCRSDILVMDVN